MSRILRRGQPTLPSAAGWLSGWLPAQDGCVCSCCQPSHWERCLARRARAPAADPVGRGANAIDRDSGLGRWPGPRHGSHRACVAQVRVRRWQRCDASAERAAHAHPRSPGTLPSTALPTACGRSAAALITSAPGPHRTSQHPVLIKHRQGLRSSARAWATQMDHQLTRLPLPATTRMGKALKTARSAAINNFRVTLDSVRFLERQLPWRELPARLPWRSSRCARAGAQAGLASAQHQEPS